MFNKKALAYSTVFIIAIAAANISAVVFGPAVTVLNAFLFIGLDITTRDGLHEMWRGRQLLVGMFFLLIAGGAVSYFINADAGQIAMASVVAFSVALVVDALIYHIAKIRGVSHRKRVNASNVGASVADSLLFPTIAFGAFLPLVVTGQILAKVFGGAIWYEVLRVLPFGDFQRRDSHSSVDA